VEEKEMNATFEGFPDTRLLASALVVQTSRDGGTTLVLDQGVDAVVPYRNPTEGFVVGGRGSSLVLGQWFVRDYMEGAIEEVEKWLVRQPSVGGTYPLSAVGGWLEEAMGLYHFDLVDVVETFDEALDLGEARGEKAIYDLKAGEDFFLPSNDSLESDGQPDLQQEYDGLFGVSDWDAERAAAEQDAFDADYSDFWGN
jgi:hypothetical protein